MALHELVCSPSTGFSRRYESHLSGQQLVHHIMLTKLITSTWLD